MCYKFVPALLPDLFHQLRILILPPYGKHLENDVCMYIYDDVCENDVRVICMYLDDNYTFHIRGPCIMKGYI